MRSSIFVHVEDILLKMAKEAHQRAYAPYSQFRVGAAVQTETGEIFSGCNIENASYGLTVCAERVAIWKAISEGFDRFSVIAIVTNGARPVPPCGACCQVLAEFNPEIKIISATLDGKQIAWKLSELFPHSFRL